MSGKIENLLKKANSSNSADSSVNFAKRRFSTETEAKNFFDRTKLKLLNLDEWNLKSGVAGFELFDETGKNSGDKTLTTGKFVSVSLPAAGKADWLEIVEIYEAKDEFVITVQPSFNPSETPVDKAVTSHFLDKQARNNFCLQQTETAVICYVIGFNEKQNTKDTKNLLETVRNAAAANFGYFLGIQKALWKTFCQNMMKDETEEA